MSKDLFIDLANQVAIQTEVKNPQSSGEDSFDDKLAEEKASRLNLDDESEERIKIKDLMDPKESAEVLISMIDALQDLGFSVAYAVKLKNKFKKEERELLDEIERKTDEEKTPQEKHLEKRFEKALARIIEKKDQLSFTDDERRQLQRPAELIIKKSGKDIPPGLALALVAGKIVGDRLIDFVME